jgi:membrane protein YqaA with SNARE-associated domain
MSAPTDLPDAIAPDDDDRAARAAELALDARSVRNLMLGLVALVLIVAALSWALRDPLTQMSAWFVEELGLWGLFGGILFTDCWIAPPLSHEPLLFFAHAGGIPFVKIWAAASTASVIAGPLGYGLGTVFGRVRFVQRRLRGSGVESLMRRRGATVVAAAAITPIPFAMSTWLAGALGLPFGRFLAACFVRVLKVALYLGLIVFGWAVV